jgi:hypothetical protein
MIDDLKNPHEAAEFLRVQSSTLARWRWAGTGPAYVRVGNRAVRYRLADLEAFIQGGGVRHEAQ